MSLNKYLNNEKELVSKNLLKSFNSIQNNKCDSLKEYIDKMSEITRNYTFDIESTVSRSRHDFSFLHLKTVQNNRFNFCQKIFQDTAEPSKLGNDIVYTNNFLGYVFVSNIHLIHTACNP